MKPTVAIIGASGVIGAHLALACERSGWQVVRISRSPQKSEHQQWRVLGPECLHGVHALVNLAGERIDKRWTQSNKEGFRQSRVGLTGQIAEWIEQTAPAQRPEIWINASAVGIYGDRGDEMLTEESSPSSCYLGQLCQDWELATHAHRLDGCRISHARIGVVLGGQTPAWQKMHKLFSLGLGGRLGSGEQWFPWVHLEDVVGCLLHLIEQPHMQGAFNIVSPESVTNRDFTCALAAELSRPACLHVPRRVLHWALGGFADALLASLRVDSTKIQQSGYVFAYPVLKSALSALVLK